MKNCDDSILFEFIHILSWFSVAVLLLNTVGIDILDNYDECVHLSESISPEFYFQAFYVFAILALSLMIGFIIGFVCYCLVKLIFLASVYLLYKKPFRIYPADNNRTFTLR